MTSSIHLSYNRPYVIVNVKIIQRWQSVLKHWGGGLSLNQTKCIPLLMFSNMSCIVHLHTKNFFAMFTVFNVSVIDL